MPNMKGFQYQLWTLVKILGKQLSCKLNFSAFLQISVSNLQDLRVTKIAKHIKFESARGKLEARNCFKRQPFTKYLTRTLFFI